LESAEEGGGEAHAEEMPAGGEKYISKQAYKAAEDDEVSFPNAAVVLVKEKKLDGWWQVEYGGKCGWAPGAYLQLLAKDRPPPVGGAPPVGGGGGADGTSEHPDVVSPVSKEPPTRRQSILPSGFEEVAKALAASTMAATTAAPSPSDAYVTLEAYEADDAGGVSFPEGVEVVLLEKAETGWWCIEYNGVEGWAPADYLAPVVGAPAATPGCAEPCPNPKPAAPPCPCCGRASSRGGG